MSRTNFQELLDAGVHFGHMARKWNPKMAPYIFDQKNGIHIIDLHKTIVKIDEAAEEMKALAKSGRKILFVATKKQAKDVVAQKASEVGMPYITERWAGGMLTNFPTIRKAVKKMSTIDKMREDGTFDKLAKRERLQVSRQREKLEKNLGSIRDMSRLPAALFVVDIQKEANAVKEANRLNIPVFALVDTCCDPAPIDYVIPANDDATKSISYILSALCEAIREGLEERKLEKDKDVDEDSDAAEERPAARTLRSRRGPKASRNEEEEVEDIDEMPVKEKIAKVKKAPKVEEDFEEVEAPKAKKAAKAEKAPKAEAPVKVEKTPAKEKAAKVEAPKVEAPAKEEAPAKKEAPAPAKEKPAKVEEAPAPVKEKAEKVEATAKEEKAEAPKVEETKAE
jgi:small subunit ribosomal protein S2